MQRSTRICASSCSTSHTRSPSQPAHSAIGGSLGLSRQDLLAARQAGSGDARTAGLLAFARTLVLQRGLVTDADLRAVRAAGASDAQIAEVVAVTALNVFTNWFNHVADPPVDFPAAEPLPA